MPDNKERAEQTAMIRPVNLSIRWELLQVYLAIFFAGSWYAMARHVYTRLRSDGESLRETLEQCTIPNYVCMTRRETGFIGPWFWLFITTFVLMILVGIHFLSGEPVSTEIHKSADYLWPIL